MDYYSAIQKNGVMPFAAAWVQPEIITLSEVSWKEKDKWLTHGITYMRDLKCDTNEPTCETVMNTENRLVIAKTEGVRGGTEWQVEVSKHKLLYTEWINTKVLLHRTQNYIQYFMTNHKGKED